MISKYGWDGDLREALWRVIERDVLLGVNGLVWIPYSDLNALEPYTWGIANAMMDYHLGE